MRTQTVPNHRDGYRDVKWGIEVVATIIAMMATVLGGVWFLSARLTTLEMEIITAKKAAAAAAEAAAVAAKELQAAQLDEAKVHATYVTHDEFYKIMGPEIPDPRRRRR